MALVADGAGPVNPQVHAALRQVLQILASMATGYLVMSGRLSAGDANTICELIASAGAQALVFMWSHHANSLRCLRLHFDRRRENE
jgi:hypothetical protein